MYKHLIRIAMIMLVLFNPFTTSFISSFIVNKYYFRNSVPTGDPYTYLNGWIDLIKLVGYPNHLFQFPIIWNQLTTRNWYWTQNFAYYFVSPILKIDPQNYYLANYLFALLASTIIYTYCKIQKIAKFNKLILIGLPIFIPGTHGLLHYTSLDVSSLDSIFLNLLISSIFIHLILLSNLKLRYVLIASVINILTLWARGNSTAQLIFCLLPILIFIVIKHLRTRDKISIVKETTQLLIYSCINIWGLYYYLKIQGSNISRYYAPHRSIYLDFRDKNYDLDEVLNFSTKAVGSLITHNRNNTLTIIFTFTIYAIAAYIFWKEVKNLELKNNEYKPIFGILISYYLVFNLLTNIVIFSGVKSEPLKIFQQSLIGGSLITWNPSLIAILLIIFYVIVDTKISAKTFVVVIIAINVFILTQIYVNRIAANPVAIQRAEIEEFVRQVDELDKSATSTYCIYLYEANFNAPLINYLRKLNDLSSLNFVIPSILWEQSQQKDLDDEIKIYETIKSNLDECQYAFIPETLEVWNQDNPYRIYKSPDLFKRIFNEQNYIVRAKVQIELNKYVLMLDLKTDKIRQSREPLLKKPYGEVVNNYEIKIYNK